MAKRPRTIDKLLGSLLERAKELNCIYEVEEIIQIPNLNAVDMLIKIGEVIPPAMQFPDICRVKIAYQDEIIIGNAQGIEFVDLMEMMQQFMQGMQQ